MNVHRLYILYVRIDARMAQLNTDLCAKASKQAEQAQKRARTRQMWVVH